MKRFSIFVLLIIALPASASYNVFYANTNFDTQFGPQYGQKILVTPIFYSNSLAPLQPRMYSCGLTTDTYPAGFWVSNMLSGRYLFTVQSTPQPTPRIFVIPDGSGNYTLTTADVVTTAAGTGFPSYADITNYVNAHATSGSATNLSPWTTDINAAKHTLTNGQADATFTLPAASVTNFYLALASGQLPLSALTNFSASMTASNYAVVAATFGISNSVIAQFGAVGGDADDTTAFQAAADSGADVFVPAITNGYTVSNIVLKNNSHFRGGGSARLKMKSTATGKFVYAQSSAVTNIIFTGFVLDGQGVGATGSGGAPWTFTAGYAVVPSFSTDRSGLYLYNNQTNSFISDLLVKNFSNKGIWIEGALGTFPQPTSHTLSGYDLRLENCYQGILFTNSAEYCSFSDVNCFHCGEAVAIWSGNVSIRGGVMTRNGCGFRVVGSGVTNPAHGSAEDVVLNHNDVAILCTDFNNGFNFNNIIILGGGGEGGGNPIFLTNTCGVNIQNSTLNSGMFASADGGSASANGYNYIDHCKVTGHVPIFQTSSGHLIYNEAVDYGVLTLPQVTNNFSMAFNAAHFPALTANQLLALNSTNRVSNISGVDISTVLHGGTPPTFQQVALATDVSGTLPDGQLSSNVGLLNRNPQTWTGSNHMAGAFEGSGILVTNLNASQLATGLIPAARLAGSAGTSSIALGQSADSTKDYAVSIGAGASSFGTNSSAIGRSTAATASNASAFGEGAQAGNVDATAIGQNAVTTATNQIMLGLANGTVNVPGSLVASGASLTSLPAGQLTGSIADARLSGNVALVTTNAFSLTASNSLPLTTNLVSPDFFLTLNGAGALTNTTGTGWANIILSNATATATNYFLTNATWRAIGSGTTNDAPAGVLSIPSGKVAYLTVQNKFGYTAYWTTVQRTP